MEGNNDKKTGDHKVSDHLANERTFLAWVRTGIGVMAFGFVVVKFSLFVKQLSLALGREPVSVQKGYSSIMGIALVVAGLLITLFAYFRFSRTQRQIEENNYKSSTLLIGSLSVFIVSMGLLLIAYLLRNT